MRKRYANVLGVSALWVAVAVLGGRAACEASGGGIPKGEFRLMRERMIEEHIRARGIRDERVIAVMARLEREKFVPDPLKAAAYEDGPLPIGEDQTISQPYIVALMSELLEIRPDDKVLEVGTGSGYQTAVLAELAREVYSIEIIPTLYAQARERLKGLGYGNIRLRLGNGWNGWPEEAPFDKIIVTAAPDVIPLALRDQLGEGGRMVLPVGRYAQQLMVVEKENGIIKKTESIPVRFVPLVKE